jgi:hypothetical protein
MSQIRMTTGIIQTFADLLSISKGDPGKFEAHLMNLLAELPPKDLSMASELFNRDAVLVDQYLKPLQKAAETPLEASESAEVPLDSFPDVKTSYVPPSFVRSMNAEIRSNEHKGDWRAWKPDPQAAILEINHHSKKLVEAIKHRAILSVSEHSADLANIAMKADECFGLQSKPVGENQRELF